MIRTASLPNKWFTLAIFSIAIFSFINSALAQEPTLEELRKDIDVKNEELRKLEEEAEKYRKEIAEHQERGQNLKSEISRLDRIIVQLRKDVAATEKRLKKTELEITAVDLEIRQKEKSLKTLRSGLAGLIQSLLEEERKPLLVTLFQQKALSNFFRQLDYSNLLQEKVLSSVEVVRTLQQELTSKKQEAEEKKKEEERLKKGLAGRQTALASEKKDRSTILQVTQNQEKKYQQLLKDRQAKIAALEEEIREVEEKLQVTIDPASLPTKGSGVLAWPLPQVILRSCKSLKETINCLTQFFGYTSFAAIGGYNGKGHNGVDFRAAMGTPVKSADVGTVETAGDTDVGCRGASYGKWVLIKPPNNLSTLYAHLSSIDVSRGQNVRREEQIGLSGQSGYATGPHLHFSVFASKAVHIESIRSRVCGRLMTLPISALNGYLNPLDYL